MYKQSDGYFWIGGPGEEAFNVPLGMNVQKGQGPQYDFLHLHYRSSAILLSMGEEPVNFIRQMKNVASDPYSGGRNFGHLAYEVDDIYATCRRLLDAGVTINRPPRDGRMAFVRSPDGISIELLQKGESLAAAEPWASMPNTGEW